MLAVAFWKNYVGSSPTIGIFLYAAQTVERVLAVAFGKYYVGSNPTIGTLLYAAQTVERVLAVAFGNKLCWFESHYRHISLCSPGSWTHASSSLWNTQHSQYTYIHAPGGIRTHNLSRQVAIDPLSAYFFMYPYDWKIYWWENLSVRVWWVCLGPRVVLISSCFRGVVREWNTVGRCSSLISAF